MTSAAMVLPVPDGPAKSALMPRPWASLRANPQSPKNALAMRHLAAQVSELLALVAGQHESSQW